MRKSKAKSKTRSNSRSKIASDSFDVDFFCYRDESVHNLSPLEPLNKQAPNVIHYLAKE